MEVVKTILEPDEVVVAMRENEYGAIVKIRSRKETRYITVPADISLVESDESDDIQSIYYDEGRGRIVAQMAPMYYIDGSFGFGEHAIPEEGPTTTFHFTCMLSPDFLFTPRYGIDHLRKRHHLHFSDSNAWKQLAKESFGEDLDFL